MSIIDFRSYTPEQLGSLTTELAEKYPEEALKGIRSRSVRTPREMIIIVAAAYEVDPDALVQFCNTRAGMTETMLQARSCLANLLRDKRFFGYTLQDIGSILHRDHSTVRTMIERARYDWRFRSAEAKVLQIWKSNVAQ